MKNKEEPSIDLTRGSPSLPSPNSASETTDSLSRPGPTASASNEKPALSLIPESLMEAVVEEANIERAWKNVRANRGAPGPDGITLAEFPAWYRAHWSTIRQQLLDGTYWPEPVRRVTIDKPDGGHRLLGIPNVLERLIQQAIVQVLTPVFDPASPIRAMGFDQNAPLTEQPSKSNVRFDEAIASRSIWTCPNFSIGAPMMWLCSELAARLTTKHC